MLVSKDKWQFYYIRKISQNGQYNFKTSLHTFGNYPLKMKSRVEEAIKILGVLKSQDFVPSDKAKTEKEEGFYLSKNVVYVTKFVKEDTQIVNKLTNGVIQVLFNDNTQVVF